MPAAGGMGLRQRKRTARERREAIQQLTFNLIEFNFALVELNEIKLYYNSNSSES